jgi:N-acetylmuramoyl-L-alanine amidase
MFHYNITQEFLQGIPKIPFRNGVGAYEGVVCHCTDSDNHSGGDTPHNEKNYEQNTWKSAFVHFFVGIENGEVIILQTAPTDYISYHCGGGNSRFIGVELCMYDDYQTFLKAYDAYVYIIAKLLYDRKLLVSSAQSSSTGTCWAHDDVRRLLGGTTHEDPIDYLKAHGISWDDHIKYVTDRYNQFVAEENPTTPVKKERKPMEQWLKDIVIQTIKDLAARDKIGNPDLWINKVNNDEDISALAIILINRLEQ